MRRRRHILIFHANNLDDIRSGILHVSQKVPFWHFPNLPFYAFSAASQGYTGRDQGTWPATANPSSWPSSPGTA